LKKFIIFIMTLSLYGAFPSWYYKVKNTSGQKQAFVEIMLPLIQAENAKIKNLRQQLISIFNDPYYLLDPQKVIFLGKTAKLYKIKNITDKEKFLKRVNTIPPSLALAQAAIESGWGKSRFVREANNIFGHWTYSNRGLAPKSKYAHIKVNYSIRIFPSLEASIAAYMKNLNRNRAYEEFRNLREQFDKEDKPFTGLDAADTMIRYSQKKEAYVKLLKDMINKNGWIKYDK